MLWAEVHSKSGFAGSRVQGFWGVLCIGCGFVMLVGCTDVHGVMWCNGVQQSAWGVWCMGSRVKVCCVLGCMEDVTCVVFGCAGNALCRTQNKGTHTGTRVCVEWGAQHVRCVENGVQKALSCTESRAHQMHTVLRCTEH